MGKNFKVKVCEVCGKEYQSTGGGQKYCSECVPVVRAEKNRAYDAKYRKKNPEKRREGIVRWKKANPEKVKAADAKHRKANRDKCAVTFNKWRAAKYANTPISEMLTSTEWLAILAEAQGHCAYCDKEAKLTLDHVIPLSKGGKHSKDNVVPACEHCNCSKGNKTVEEWLGKKHKATVTAIEAQIMEVHRG